MQFIHLSTLSSLSLDNLPFCPHLLGQVKRFQPGKPCTKAQAAVALTGGKFTKLIHQEFSKLKSENSSRNFAIEEIKSELLERGEIQRFWEKKIQDEKRHRLEVEAAYFKTLKDLENQKINQDNAVNAYLKEIAALDCQKQLLLSLEKEVDEMNERLSYERKNFVDEKQKTRSNVGELEVKYERILDTKSILEAELEALRILRYTCHIMSSDVMSFLLCHVMLYCADLG